MMGEGHDTRVCLTTWIVVALMMMCSCLLVEGSHVVYEQLQSIPASIVNNTYRTGYHFQPPQHWINDPNGPMYYNGIYHLFYQYNPYGSVWGNIEWAHSVSKDLINWISVEPAAIAPSKPFDINGCWSGSATILPGRGPVILYTGKDSQNRQVQNIAIPKNVSDPYLREWIKPDRNPLMVPVGGINASEFRDPTTAWRAPDNRWRVVVGSLRKHRGMAILYRSKDFVNWIRAKHPLHSAIGTGMWECPDFYPVSLEGKQGLDTSAYGSGLKHVFKVSLDLTRYEYYTLGTYDLDKDRYVPDTKSIDYGSGLRYDYGNFYASKSFFDAAKRRRILWGWSNESDTRQNDISKGWAGIQTIPRDVWLDTNGRQLVQWPVEELEGLRGKRVSIQNKKIKSGDVVEVKGITAAQADVEVAFQLSSLAEAESFDPSWTDPQQLCEQKGADAKGGVGPFGLLVLASGDRREQTAVFFRIFKAYTKYVVLMCHDASRSSLRPELYKPTFGGFIDVGVGEYGMISLRSLIDHSVVESFGAKGRTCITSRVYPSIALGQNAHLFAFNYGTEEVKITQLKAWQMKKPLMNEA